MFQERPSNLRTTSETQTAHSRLSGSSAHYLAQERAYIKKLKNVNDDYYTKGITSSATESESEDDDDDDDDLESNSSELLQNDLIANINPIGFGDNAKLDLAYAAMGTVISHKDTDSPVVKQRLEWQAMLSSVLNGDVLRSEKTKIIKGNENYVHLQYKENLWLCIRSRLLGRTIEDQQRVIEYSRTTVDEMIKEISNFKVDHSENCNISPNEQISNILEKWDHCESLWPTWEDMVRDKPLCESDTFKDRLDALLAWSTISSAIQREIDSLREWTQNDDFDVTRPAPNQNIVDGIVNDDNSFSFAERILKQKEIGLLFQKRIFDDIDPLAVKAKAAQIEFGEIFRELELPSYIDDLLILIMFPTKLIQEIIRLRVLYAKRLPNPTLMMIDQMIGDFHSYIALSIKIKKRVVDFCSSQAPKWNLETYLDENFDSSVLDCVSYYLILLHRKLLDSSKPSKAFRTFKEPDELEQQWNFLKPVATYITGGGELLATQFSFLTSKMVSRLLAYLDNQLKGPPIKASAEMERWYSSTTENLGVLQRRLLRFSNVLSKTLQNSSEYYVKSAQSRKFLEALKESGHFLIYTGEAQTNGVYLIACDSLYEQRDRIDRILKTSGLEGEDDIFHHREKDKLRMTSSPDLINDNQNQLQNDNQNGNGNIDEFFEDDEPAYFLAICPQRPMVWSGRVLDMKCHTPKIATDLKQGRVKLIVEGPAKFLKNARSKFSKAIGETASSLEEHRSALPKVHHELIKTTKLFSKLSFAVLDSVTNIRKQSIGLGCQELVNNMFIFARDFGRNLLRHTEASRRAPIIRKLIDLSIEWVSFVCDDCVPTDPKTFRWTVAALEFAMDMTKDFNILAVSDTQFNTLRKKVARCMTLLISHFDIMGARSSAAEKKRMLRWSKRKRSNLSTEHDDSILALVREEIVRKIQAVEESRAELQQRQHSVGRVLDDTDTENQFLTFLASSFSSVSIRWQQGRFVGGGTFGSVYTAVNLDTGGVMAVKEIRLHDSQSIRHIVPSIKDEMTVLEMLNHPNIVQYFGVEVHRDKVYIFMEFCQGGSLATLLEHGRIEDESIIQIYTLQMLEGLAYLHKSGIVHRDLKPENILLDHNGVIKFVDFGAAKVIAMNGRTAPNKKTTKLNSMTGTPMYMSPEVITGSSSGKNGSVDIWSLGCIVLELATGRRPWANLDNEWAIMYHIAAGHLPQFPTPDQLSKPGINFLSKCLEHDPSKRLTAVELLEDPWMTEIRLEAFGNFESGSSSTDISGSLSL